jgi:hypothetical protein
MDVMKHFLRDGTNCVLRYVLSQPVEIDPTLLFYFLLQYSGLTMLMIVVKYVRSIIDIIVFELKHSSVNLLTAEFDQRSGD